MVKNILDSKEQCLVLANLITEQEQNESIKAVKNLTIEGVEEFKKSFHFERNFRTIAYYLDLKNCLNEEVSDTLFLIRDYIKERNPGYIESYSVIWDENDEALVRLACGKEEVLKKDDVLKTENMLIVSELSRIGMTANDINFLYRHHANMNSKQTKELAKRLGTI